MFGVLTITIRVRGVIAAAIASTSRSSVSQLDAHLDRHETGLDDQRFVGKPGRQAVDDLVTRIGNGLHPDREGGEPAGGEQDVVRLEGETGQLPERRGGGLLRRGLVLLVGEPVLALRRERGSQGRDIRLRRHLARVAEGEVEHARLLLRA